MGSETEKQKDRNTKGQREADKEADRARYIGIQTDQRLTERKALVLHLFAMQPKCFDYFVFLSLRSKNTLWVNSKSSGNIRTFSWQVLGI